MDRRPLEPSSERPRVVACLLHSLALFRARPFVLLALGAAVVLSLVSVCCGVGVATAPWFLSELLAVQLAEGIGQPIERSRGFFTASLVWIGAVLLASSVAWLSLLALGSGDAVASSAPSATGLATPLLTSDAVFALVAAVIALGFVLPFLYVTPILIEGRTSLGGAALESARLVARGGVLAHLALSLSAHALQVLPLGLGLLAHLMLAATWSAPVALLLALPALCVSVPLGQGMIASAYLARRGEVVASQATRPQGSPSRALVACWVVLVLAPLLSFGALGASLLRPSYLRPGALPEGGELLAEQTLSQAELTVRPAGTALTLSASTRGAEVLASDGGGAGALPVRGGAPLEHARVARVRDAYAIEVTRGGVRYLGWVDAAGVRLDDDLRARLLDRVSPLVLLSMLGGLFATALLGLPVLARLAEVRRAYALAGDTASSDALEGLRRSATRRAALSAALLAPACACSLFSALRALIGG